MILMTSLSSWVEHEMIRMKYAIYSKYDCTPSFKEKNLDLFCYYPHYSVDSYNKIQFTACDAILLQENPHYSAVECRTYL